MSTIGQLERKTQNRIIAVFRALKQAMMQELLTGRTRLVESGKLKVDGKG